MKKTAPSTNSPGQTGCLSIEKYLNRFIVITLHKMQLHMVSGAQHNMFIATQYLIISKILKCNLYNFSVAYFIIKNTKKNEQVECDLYLIQYIKITKVVIILMLLLISFKFFSTLNLSV